MGLRIQQLPSFIANQIAAGEVIERPASVVKELLENSLDAGATEIHIDIDYGGFNLIRISDNGHGIVAEDLPLAITAHATSKIKTLDDLFAINSMGFRGEALASIAAIAKLMISSRPVTATTAMCLQVQETNITLHPCARSVGTTVEVSDLFFNAPVRKRFLKSEKIEFQAIEQVVKRFALSAPTVALTLKHNGKIVFTLPAAQTSTMLTLRMKRLLGSAFVKDAIELEVAHAGMNLRGWISNHQFQRSQNDRQWLYINQRMVKDKLLLHALKQAYAGILHPGRFPACVLYLDLNPAEIDVNVHPTKHEVRFEQPRIVHDFITSQVTLALDATQKAPAMAVVGKEIIKNHPDNTSLSEPTPLWSQSVEKVDKTRSWILLHNCFAIVHLEHQPHLIHLDAVYKHMLKTEINKHQLPLRPRPLLIPLKISLQEHLWDSQESWIPQLALMGMQCIPQLDRQEVRVTSLPVILPHLDLIRFFTYLQQSFACSLAELQKALIEAQTVDFRTFDEHERVQLLQYVYNLASTESTSSFMRKLTVEDCWNLLHA